MVFFSCQFCHIFPQLVQLVSGVAQLAEIDKMKLHIAEMDKMTALLVSLSGRLARVETEMEAMAAVADTDEKVGRTVL